MLEYFFKDQAVAEQLKQSVLGPQIDTFVSVVYDLGYSPSTIRTQLMILVSLTRWVQKNKVDIFHMNENITNRFLFESGRKGSGRRGDNKTLRCFLDHLRTEGLIDSLETSIVPIAPFTVCFPERISNFQKCPNAPLLVSFSGMITLELQETPFVVTFSNIDYLRFGNVKFNDKSMTLRDQEKS